MKPENTPPEQTGAADPQEQRKQLDLKKAKIQVLEDELSETDAKLDAEFMEKIDSLMSPEQLELRFEDDPRPFIQALEEAREGFYREKLEGLKNTIDTMRKEVNDEEESLSIEEAKRAFLAAHPEADWNALVDFWKNHVTQYQKDELAQYEGLELIEKGYELYVKKNKKSTPAPAASPEPAPKGEPEPAPAPAAQIPANLNNIPASAVKGDPGVTPQDEAYLKAMGLR